MKFVNPQRSARIFALGLGLCGGCQPPPASPPPPTPEPRPAEQLPRPSQTKPTNESPPLPPPTPLLVLSDPVALRELERRGFDFRRFALASSEATPNDATGYLTSPRYRELVSVLERELAAVRTADPALGVGMRHAHRLFDARWLRSAAFHFELVGVVNRIDRRAFAPDTCGELRLVYRLAYDQEVQGQRVRSRVPLTLNVVRWLPKNGPDNDRACTDQAKRWLVQATGGEALAEELTSASGPLSDAAIRETLAKSVELDLQSVRWPATVRPNMTGHAEYLLKVFRVEGERWAEGPLENTPDIALLRARPALREELWRWLQTPDALGAADAGTLVVPERFLAKRAVSVAPHGLARLANRPYSVLFAREPLAQGSDLSAYRSFTSQAALLRRLDGLSCMGCHQSKSLAGFHFLGEDAPERSIDALAVAFSPHVAEELTRRTDYLSRLLSGAAPSDVRLPAERMGAGGYAAHCGLTASFSAWTCDTGYACARLHDAEVGQCMPVRAEIGDACEMGSLGPAENPHKDSVRLARPSNCGADRYCERSGVGFPGGMCSAGCNDLSGEARCGGIALLTEFNQCLARGLPFETCVREQTRPGALRACSTEAPCRDDYVCARLQSGEGACIPPYFLFQLRVDGHPI